MHIDCSKLPNPLAPVEDDVYMTPDRRRTLVVTRVPEHAIEDRDPSAVISYVLDGSHLACPQGQLVAITTSILARPWGRLDRSQAAQLRLSRDQDVVAERLAAFGPHLRALREQAGLSMGDLARALGCPGARLSQLELAQPDPVREGAGVREDEGRAALANLLAASAVEALVGFLPPEQPRDTSGKAEEPSPALVLVWEALHVMLSTAPARAAMATIQAARRDNAVLDAGPFRVGDRVIYKEMEARIAELDDDLAAAMLQRPGGEHLIAPFTDIQLANETVNVQTARAGLALYLARAVARSIDPRSEAEIERSDELRQLQTTIGAELADDAAQRLIRLHG